jgi:hypothetical protein
LRINFRLGGGFNKGRRGDRQKFVAVLESVLDVEPEEHDRI